MTVIGRFLSAVHSLRKTLASESKKKKLILSKNIRKLQELIDYKNLNCYLVTCNIRNKIFSATILVTLDTEVSN